MKCVVIVCGQDCVYCKKAKMLVDRALLKEPKFKAVELIYVMEESECAKAYAHTLIPAFFFDDILEFEGNPNMQIVTAILKKGYDSYFLH